MQLHQQRQCLFTFFSLFSNFPNRSHTTSTSLLIYIFFFFFIHFPSIFANRSHIISPTLSLPIHLRKIKSPAIYYTNILNTLQQQKKFNRKRSIAVSFGKSFLFYFSFFFFFFFFIIKTMSITKFSLE